jgi:ribosome maturation protein Sdo1
LKEGEEKGEEEDEEEKEMTQRGGRCIITCVVLQEIERSTKFQHEEGTTHKIIEESKVFLSNLSLN